MNRALASLLLVLSFARVAAAPPPTDRVWFCPGPWTLHGVQAAFPAVKIGLIEAYP